MGVGATELAAPLRVGLAAVTGDAPSVDKAASDPGDADVAESPAVEAAQDAGERLPVHALLVEATIAELNARLAAAAAEEVAPAESLWTMLPFREPGAQSPAWPPTVQTRCVGVCGRMRATSGRGLHA